MKKHLVLVSSLIVILSAVTFAGKKGDEQCNHEGKGKHGGPWKALNLTDEQKLQLKDLRDEGKTEIKEHFEKVREIREKIKDELLKEKPDKKALRKYGEALGKLHVEMHTNKTDHMLKVKEILSPEQFKMLLEKENKLRMGSRNHHKNRHHRKHHSDAPMPPDHPGFDE